MAFVNIFKRKQQHWSLGIQRKPFDTYGHQWVKQIGRNLARVYDAHGHETLPLFEDETNENLWLKPEKWHPVHENKTKKKAVRIGRGLHRYRVVKGSNPVEAWIFQVSFSQLQKLRI